MKVLVIEDDADTVANLRDILELDGYVVTAVSTIREATEHRNWSDISVAILDRQLPDGTADSLLPHLQQVAKHVAVIVVTGHANLDASITALRHGAADYLLKPINPDALRATLLRIARLQEAEERAVQAERLAAIGQMVTVLTHESRNALARGQAYLDLLAREVNDRPRAAELITRVQKAQDDLHHLFEEIRDFAAPMTIESGVWDLGGIWRQAWANLIAIDSQGKAARLVEDTSGTDLRCAVDMFRLEQVFRNLFENSLAACSNPVEVNLSCAGVTLRNSPAVQVTYRDNGPGLSSEQRRRVFEPFYTTKSKGTGLGMAIVRRAVEAHGGSIRVGDTPGPGAEFVIVLPRWQEPSAKSCLHSCSVPRPSNP